MDRNLFSSSTTSFLSDSILIDSIPKNKKSTNRASAEDAKIFSVQVSLVKKNTLCYFFPIEEFFLQKKQKGNKKAAHLAKKKSQKKMDELEKRLRALEAEHTETLQELNLLNSKITELTAGKCSHYMTPELKEYQTKKKLKQVIARNQEAEAIDHVFCCEALAKAEKRPEKGNPESSKLNSLHDQIIKSGVNQRMISQIIKEQAAMSKRSSPHVLHSLQKEKAQHELTKQKLNEISSSDKGFCSSVEECRQLIIKLEQQNAQLLRQLT